MSDVPTLTFCLTFEHGIASLLSAYARRLSYGLATDYVLAPEVHPHVTLLKYNLPLSSAETVRDRLSSCLPRRIVLRFQGLTLQPGPRGDVWLMLGVARTAELILLQEIASQATAGCPTRTALGDLWWPHVTLLHSVDGRLPTEWALDSNLLRAEEIVAVPSLGVNHRFGQLTEILHRFD